MAWAGVLGSPTALGKEMTTKPPVGLTDVGRDYPDYLRDESRMVGCADSISFAHGEADVCAILRHMGEAGIAVTTQGARTGITGGAVPQGGHVINLSRMNRMLGLRRRPCDGTYCLTVQPGVLLSEIQAAVSGKSFDAQGWSEASLASLAEFQASGNYLFAPDPTEITASIGGMAACNASGARSFRYGATRRSIDRVRLVLSDGAVLDLRRGHHKANGRRFRVAAEEGRVIEGDLPAFAMPRVKNAAGYFVEDDMDLIDLFIGSEGTLGVFVELDLVLAPAPSALWGVTTFFPSEDAAIRFVRGIRKEETRPAAIEFVGPQALDLLRKQKAENPAFAELPDLEDDWQASIYVEYVADSEDAAERAVMRMSEILQECGGSEDATWLASNAREVRRFKDFRHAVPEIVNLLIDERKKHEPRLTKLGTDLAVPDANLEEVIALYHSGLKELGLEYVMFGHIGSNHVHVNILPHTMEDYERGKALYRDWSREVVRMGGTVSAEHGVGKMKTALLEEMYGKHGVGQMRATKRLFDPKWILNPGNLFESK